MSETPDSTTPLPIALPPGCDRTMTGATSSGQRTGRSGVPGTTRGPLRLAPVGAVGGEYGLAARRGGRPVQGVGRCAPDGVVRRGTMRFERGLVLVDLEEVIGVLVLVVLQHVEPETAGLVPLRTERVHLDRLEKPLSLVRLHAHFHPDCEHGGLLVPVGNADGNANWPRAQDQTNAAAQERACSSYHRSSRVGRLPSARGG